MPDPKKETLIDPLSVVALHLECLLKDRKIGGGSGFVVEHKGGNYLVTNWHVVTGRSVETGEPMGEFADPDVIKIWHHENKKLGWWKVVFERLIDLKTKNKAWIEHPRERKIDVVALPLSPLPEELTTYPLDLSLVDTDLKISPSEAVSIIGFPFELSSAGKFPIWKTGHIASEIDVDFQGRPAFLIDATTRSGMSGSPVVARRMGSYQNKQGAVVMGGGRQERFLGIYSGRIHGESDIGIVWKPETITDLLK